MQWLSLKNKLILSLSLILTFGFLLTNLVNYQVSSRSLRKSLVEQTLPLTRDNIYSNIQNDLLKPVYVSSLMANDTFLKEWSSGGERDTSKITKYLLEIRDKYGFFSTFFVSQLTGYYYHFDGILKKIDPKNDHDVWFYDFMELDADYDLSVDTNEAANNTLTVFINHRLKDLDGRVLGVTGVGLNMEMIANLMLDYQKSYGRNIYLVDQAGTIKVHKNQQLIDTTTIFDQPGIGRIAAQVLAVGPDSDFFEYSRQGKNILLTSRYIPEFDWYLLVEQDETEALTGIKNNFFRNLAFGFLVIILILCINIYTINKFQDKLEQMATTDKLTGAFNRRELDRKFEQAAYLSRRQQKLFSIVLFDLDHFKDINDKLGHVTGDLTLKQVVGLTSGCIRQNDLLVRWGGDEFVILIHGELAEAFLTAERIRTLIHDADLLCPQKLGNPRVTISCGIVQYDGKENLDSLLFRADQALYQAKDLGRNRSVSFPELPMAQALRTG